MSRFLIEKKNCIIFFAILLVQMLIIVFYGFQKSNYYWDEFATFKDAADFYDKIKCGIYIDQKIEYGEWNSVSDLKSIYCINEANATTLSKLPTAVMRMFKIDPYMGILNIYESLFFRNIMSKWVGISLNIIFFIILQIMLYKLSTSVIDDGLILKYLPMILYGFSGIAISMGVFIRQYVFLAMLLILATYMFYQYWESKKWYYSLLFEILALVCIYLAFVGSEVTGFYGIGLVAGIAVMLLFTRQWKKFSYSILPGIVVGGYFIVFKTRFIREILATDINTLNPSAGASDYLIYQLFTLSKATAMDRCKYFFDVVSRHLFGNKLLLIIWLLVVGCMIVLGIIKRVSQDKVINNYIWVLLIALLVFFSLATAFGLDQIRYISFVFPEIALVTVAVWSMNATRNNMVSSIILLGLTIVTIVMTLISGNIDNLYLEDKGVREHINKSGLRSVVVDVSFFASQNAVEYCCDEEKIYFSRDLELDYSKMDDQFLLWIGSFNQDDVSDLEANGYEVEEFDDTYLAKIYKCTKKV